MVRIWFSSQAQADQFLAEVGENLQKRDVDAIVQLCDSPPWWSKAVPQLVLLGIAIGRRHASRGRQPPLPVSPRTHEQASPLHGPEVGAGMIGEPTPHYYFHRPLSVLLVPSMVIVVVALPVPI